MKTPTKRTLAALAVAATLPLIAPSGPAFAAAEGRPGTYLLTGDAGGS